MVETCERRAPPPRRDWLAIREAHRAGMSLEGLSLREGIGVPYLKDGLMWVERILPASRTASLKVRLEAHLEAAERHWRAARRQTRKSGQGRSALCSEPR